MDRAPRIDPRLEPAGHFQPASRQGRQDGHFFETALIAWRKSLDEWSSYGNRELPTSAGFNILLNDKEKIDEQMADAQRQLDRLCPGAREAIKEERRAKLSSEQKLALEAPPDKKTTEQFSLASARASHKVSLLRCRVC